EGYINNLTKDIKEHERNNSDKTLVYIYLFFTFLLLGMAIGNYAKITGFASDDIEVFAGKDEYHLGDMAHIFIIPDDMNYSIEIFDPEGDLIAISEDFPVEKIGNYTIKVSISDVNETEIIYSSLNVVPINDSSEEAPAANTPTNQTDSAAGALILADEKGVIKDNRGIEVGRKINDNPDYEIIFTEMGIKGADYAIKFYHNDSMTQPIWIEGHIHYVLSSMAAGPNETVELRIPAEEKIPKFSLHVGVDPEVFEFEINIEENNSNSSKNLSVQKIKQKDINITKEDITERTVRQDNKDVRIAKIEKDGLKVEIKGAKKNDIKNVWLRKGVFHIDEIQIEEAKIEIPREITSSIINSPKLYYRQGDSGNFTEAAPYCKNKTITWKENITVDEPCDKQTDPLCLKSGKRVKEIEKSKVVEDKDNCFNKVDVTASGYVFTVEHFSSYYINTTGNFSTLQDCLNFINTTTGDQCVIAASDYYEKFANRSSYNISTGGWVIAINGRDNVFIDFNGSDFLVRPNFIYENEGVNHTWVNFIINLTGGGDVFNGGTGLDGNWTYENITTERCTTFFNFGTGNYDSNITLRNVYSSCSVSAYASNLIADNITIDGVASITLNWYNTKDRITNSRFINGAYMFLDSTNNLWVENCTFNNKSLYSNGAAWIRGATIKNNQFNGDPSVNYALLLQADSYNNTIEYNNFSNYGNVSYSSEFQSSLSPLTYGGNDFDNAVIYVNSSLGSSIVVTSDDTDVSSEVDGTNTFRLWLIDIPAASIPFSTLYVEEPPVMNCNNTATAYGGTCYLDEANYWVFNTTTGNYDVNATSLSSVIGGYTNPPYLNNVTIPTYHAVALNLTTSTGNIIKGNTFTGEVSMYDESPDSNISLNNFYEASPLAVGTSSYCVNNEGNFYNESLMPVSGDCGPANVTFPGTGDDVNGNNIFKTNWSGQSSINTVNYDVFINRTDSGTKTKIGTTTDLNMSIDASLLARGYYNIFLIPFVYGSRINATNEESGVFYLNNTAPTISSVVLNATSINNLTTDNLTTYPEGISDIDGDSVTLNYNWYRNGTSETLLNMPFTAPDSNNQTYDLSGYGNEGNVINASWNATAGHDGFGAFEFDGIDDYIDLDAYSSQFNNLATGTISIWFKHKGNSGPDAIFASSDKSDGSSDLRIQFNSGPIIFAVRENGGNKWTFTTSSDYDDGKWHHLALAVDSNGNRIYIDGSPAAGTYSVGSATSTEFFDDVLDQDTLRIGINEDSGGNQWPFNGSIDEVRIWNRSLSSNEVNMIYNNITNITHSDATTVGDNWTAKITPIDVFGLNGTGIFSNSVSIKVNNAPTITSVLLNATSQSNISSDNLTANPIGVEDQEEGPVQLNYNWYKNGISENVLNVPFTQPDSTGGNRTYDFSGHDNHGNVSGALWNMNGGYDGFGAYEFDGNGDFINFGNDTELSLGQGAGKEWTISLWYYMKDNSKGMHILDKASGISANTDYAFLYSASIDKILWGTGSSIGDPCAWNSAAAPPVNQWNHLVGVLSSTGSETGSKQFYINGELINDCDYVNKAPATATNLFIGKHYDGSNLFNGSIDEIRIYNRSLSAHEVALLYNNITNITHNNATSGAENWTVKVTPIDSYGLNGSAVWSNDVNITDILLSVYNQTPTDQPYLAVNDTEPVNPFQNLTIRINATNVGGTVSSVWIVIWQTVKSAGDILLQGVMSLVGDFYEAEVPVNHSYPGGVVNYTVFANDTYNKTVELEGNFSVNQPPTLTSVLLNATSNSNTTYYNLTAYPSGINDPEDHPVQLNYNWYKNGISDTVLNMPFTKQDPTEGNRTYDFSGNNNHGIPNGAIWNATGGHDGFGAYEFYGNNDYVVVEHSDKLVTENAFTIMGWFYLNTHRNWNGLITKTNSGIAAPYDMWVNSAGTLTFFTGNGAVYDAISTSVNIKTWYHVAGVYDGTDFYLYINGVEKSSKVAPAVADAGTNFMVGSRNDLVTDMDGNIDDVRVYNRSLSVNEILLIYQNTTNITHSDATTIEENWSVKVTPIDDLGLNGSSVWSNNITIKSNDPPNLTSVLLNATSTNNFTSDNLTAYPSGVSDGNGESVTLNYNWYVDGVSDMVLNMPFTAPDTTTGNKTYDFSGNNNHGNKSGAIWSKTGGHDGFGAYEFDGDNDFIVVEHSDSLVTENAFSISVWFYINTHRNFNGLVSKSESSLAAPYDIWVNANGVLKFFIGNGVAYEEITTPVDTQKWHHLAAVYDGTDYFIYLDGIEKNSSTAPTIGDTAKNIVIGSRNDLGSDMNGTIDDVRIYNRSLSAHEIALLYNNRTNITHNNATSGGDNWTVKVTPIDEWGLNGSAVWSNSINITEMLIEFVNQTNPAGEIINETESILANQNLTIRFNISNIGGSISSVWIKVWETTKAAGTVLWEGLMSLVGGIWQVEVPVNGSYPTGQINYTVYVNDTLNITYETEGNFSMKFCYPCYVNSSGGDFKKITDCMDYINNTNQTCVLNENSQYNMNGTYSYNLSGAAIQITSENITLDCNNSWIKGINSSKGISIEANNATVQNCYISNYYYGIYLQNVSYCVLSRINSTVNYWDNLMINDSNYNLVDSSFFSLSQRGNGLRLHNSSHNNITNSNFTNNNYSTKIKTSFTGDIILNMSSYNRIVNNTLTYSGFPASINLWTNSSHNLIANNTALYSYDHAIGIYEDSFNNTIDNNNLSSNHDAAINMKTANTIINNYMEGNEEGGIIVGQGSTLSTEPSIIANNTIMNTRNNLTEPGDNGISMWITLANNISIVNNRVINGNSIGVYVVFSNDIRIENNTISGNNVSGMRIASSYSVNITGNMIINQTSSPAIILINSNNTNISNNTINNNQHGIKFINVLSWNNSILSNNIYNNTIGINCTYAALNNISGNSIENVYDFVSGTDCFNNSIWLNGFYGDGVNDTDVNNTYCVNNEGNLYEESIVPITGDCGPSNFTYPLERQVLNPFDTFIANWTRQSSTKTVMYDLLANRTSDGTKTKIGNTTSLNATFSLAPTSIASGNYTLLLVPWVRGSRINATNAIGGNITVNGAPTLESVVLNATSLSNHTSDNLTANPSGISDGDGDSVTLNYNWIRNGLSDTVLNMPFTAPDSNNITYDFSGLDNYGTITQGVLWNNTAGHDGFGAYEFDGIDDYVLVQNSQSINFTTEPFSIEMWVYKKGPGQIVEGDKIYILAAKSNASLAAEEVAYGFAQYDEDFPFGIANLTGFAVSDGTNTYTAISPTPILPGSWHHIVGVWNTTDVLIYMDGIEEATASAAITVNAIEYNLTIGAVQGNDTTSNQKSAFNGTIDEVRIYNRSLSANEIALLYSNRTNITHSDATTAGENWTVKATPIDSYGLNGTAVWSNSINITEMLIEFVNQTNPAGEIINETESILANQNLTIRFNITNIGGSISSVWIKIWQTTKEAGTILWQGLMSLIGGIWQVEVPTNETWPQGLVDYTIYANDTVNRTYEIEGNFSIGDIAITSCRDLNISNRTYVLLNNISSAKTCINIRGNNVTLDCRGYEIDFGNSKAQLEFAPGIAVYSNDSTIKNCRVERDTEPTGYGYGIYTAYANNTLIYNNTVFTRNYADFGVVITYYSTYTNMTNNTVITYGSAGSAVLITANSSYGIYEYNNITTDGALGWGYDIRNSAFNTFRNNTMITRMVAPFKIVPNQNPEYYSNVSIDTSNLAYGKPVNYTWNMTDWVIDSANMSVFGQLIISNSSNISIKNSEFTNSTLLLVNVNNARIDNNTIDLAYSDGIHGSRLTYSNITNNRINVSSSDGGGIAIATYSSSDYLGIE
ncbi:MAG: right-handed parallel beta-helix repeat-containing protein, partial [Nanoarchaeota archaeon]|nr:right-handed parallel beta-helix repeat-containing protein [Nanoarchaeota archaeon]